MMGGLDLGGCVEFGLNFLACGLFQQRKIHFRRFEPRKIIPQNTLMIAVLAEVGFSFLVGRTLCRFTSQVLNVETQVIPSPSEGNVTIAYRPKGWCTKDYPQCRCIH